MAIFECVIMYRDRHQITFQIDAISPKDAYQKALQTGKDVFTIVDNPNNPPEGYLRIHLKQIETKTTDPVPPLGMSRFAEEKPVSKKKK